MVELVLPRGASHWRLEAITSRPLLLAAVGKAASHANQTTLYLTPLHGRADILKWLFANIGAALRHVKAAAEQFKDLDRWGCLLRHISNRIAPVVKLPQPPPGLPAAGQLPDSGSVVPSVPPLLLDRRVVNPGL